MAFSRVAKDLIRHCVYQTLLPLTYPTASHVRFPFQPQQEWGYGDVFGKWCRFDGKNWGYHLGADYSAAAGTPVASIGCGRVVYASFHPGVLANVQSGRVLQRNWGGIVIIAHRHPKTRRVFLSLYGHLGSYCVQAGQYVDAGMVIGVVGEEDSPSNGLWESHLHLGICDGSLWFGRVLPGYWKGFHDIRTDPRCWLTPPLFFGEYSSTNDSIFTIANGTFIWNMEERRVRQEREYS